MISGLLIFGIKKFHQYWKFTLITDHKPLTAILGPKKGIPTLAAARLQRWALLLSVTLMIKFKPTLACRDCHSPKSLQKVRQTEDIAVFNLSQIESLRVVVSEISQATHSDPILSNVC